GRAVWSGPACSPVASRAEGPVPTANEVPAAARPEAFRTVRPPRPWLAPWRPARPPGAVRGRSRAARPAQPALVASRSLPRAAAGRWGPSARPAPVLVQEHAHRDEDGQRVTLGRLVQLDARSVRRHCVGAVVPETDREAMRSIGWRRVGQGQPSRAALVSDIELDALCVSVAQEI